MSEARTHDLKCEPWSFAAIESGRKRFEVRRDDRGYLKGDLLLLREWQPMTRDTGQYTGRSLTVRVGYILADPEGRWLQPGCVVLGIEREAPQPTARALTAEQAEFLSRELAEYGDFWTWAVQQAEPVPTLYKATLAALRGEGGEDGE